MDTSGNRLSSEIGSADAASLVEESPEPPGRRSPVAVLEAVQETRSTGKRSSLVGRSTRMST